MDLQNLATQLKDKVSNESLLLDNSTVQQDSFKNLLSFFDQKITLTDITEPDQQITVNEAGTILTIAGNQMLYKQNVATEINLSQKAETDTSLASDYSTFIDGVTFENLVNWKIIPTNIFDPTPYLPTLPFVKVHMEVRADASGKLEDTNQTWIVTGSDLNQIFASSIGLDLTDFGFNIQRTPKSDESGYDTTFIVTGHFELGADEEGTTTDVSIAVPINQGDDSTWKLNLTSDVTLADGISDLLQLVFGNNLFADIPPGFQDAVKFGLTELEINFKTTSDEVGNVEDAKIVIERSEAWTINTFTIQSAGATFNLSKGEKSYEVNTTIYGKFEVGSENTTIVYLDVTMDIPSGKSDWLAQMSGSLENNTIDSLFASLPITNVATLPEFPIGLDLDSITLDYLKIAFNPSSKILTSVDFDVKSEFDFSIFNIISAQNPYAALNVKNPTNNSNWIITGDVGGNLIVGNVPFTLKAEKPKEDSGWTLTGNMEEDSRIELISLVQYFLSGLNIVTLPGWVMDENGNQLEITKVEFSSYIPTKDSKDQSNKYSIEGDVEWKINYNSFDLPKLEATVKAEYEKEEGEENGSYSGDITVNYTFLGLPFNIGYKFGSAATEVYLEWLGIKADYTSKDNIDTITITFADMSVGEILTHLIASIDQGFKLPSPWNKLNSVNLSGLSLVYTRNTEDSSKDKMVITYNKEVNLVFLKFSQLTLTKDESGVFIGFEGTFLGQKISSDDPLGGKGEDVTKLGSGDTAVPGMGSQYFDLEYLGLGQHIALQPYEQLTTVEEAIEALENAFTDPKQPDEPSDPPIIPVPTTPVDPQKSYLIYNQDSNWLIATKFTVINAVTLGVVFNDPNLYGLLVECNGEVVGSFDGLKFQILYKKVSDSVGVYQIELKLPDSIRELQFGAVSVTLPIIGVDIYTNGSFKLDFGFPANLDFSNSMTIQAFPFTGSGGFYIAYLHDVPTDQVPTTTAGIFNPIIEFGLGMQVGVGKSINKGILKANFSVTIVGIFEGVIAFYTPNPGNPGEGDTYYKLSATVGIVGNLYGEVNFAIISASVDVTVYAYVQMVVEAYKAIPVYLEAGVSVSLKVTVNLGLFKIKTNLKFSTTVSASFLIGSDSSAPWDYISGVAAPRYLAESTNSLNILWQPLLLTATEKEIVNLYYFPQLTIADDGGTQQTQMANLLYIDAPEDGGTIDSSLNNLVKGILYWCINAVINSEKTDTTLDDLKGENVSYDILQQLFTYLSDTADNPTPIPYSTSTNNDIRSFLENYFNIFINAPLSENEKENEINGSIFPIFPELSFSWELNGDTHALETSTVTESYIEQIQALFQELQVNFQDTPQQEADQAELASHGVTDTDSFTTDSGEESMPTFIFEDYTLMVAKSVVQDALDEFENFSYDPNGDSLQDIVNTFNELTFTNPTTGIVTTNSLTTSDVATTNSSVPLTSGLAIQLTNITYQVAANDSFNAIVALFNQGLATANQITIADLNDVDGFNKSIQGLVLAGTQISIEGYTPSTYTVAPGQTLSQIAASIISVSAGESISVDDLMTAIAGQQVLLSLTKMVIPTLIYTTGDADTLGDLATNYGLTITDLANANSHIKNLFDAQSITIANLQVLGVATVVNTFDTSDNIARISGMSSRYFLHGLRLPDPTNMSSVSALYRLTGQQFAIPTSLAQNDDFNVLLHKTDIDWVTLKTPSDIVDQNQLVINIPNPSISQINDLKTISLSPDTSPQPPQAIPLGRTSNQTFTLKPGISWQYPGSIAFPIGTPLTQSQIYPSIWKFSDALMDQLEQDQPAGGLDLELVKLIQKTSGGSSFTKESVQNYAFSTFIEVGVQKIVSGTDNAPILANTYEVIGANDTSIVFLERLIQYMNANGGDNFIEQIQILYAPAQSSNTPTGVQSAANGNLTTALVQANLSTDTNPTQGGLLATPPSSSPNTLNTFQDFISLLWQCSIVRTGGYYLLYSTHEDNGPLPEQLFSKSPTANIYLLITYKNSLSESFVNSVAIADTIDHATTTVYVQSDALQTTTPAVPAGNIGVETERVLPHAYEPIVPYPIPPTPESKTQDNNYLENQFNLLGYQIVENDDFNEQASLLPIGPTNSASQDDLPNLGALPPESMADENWNYNTYLPVAAFAKNRIQPSEPIFPSSDNDPYAGIGGMVNLQLNWQDMLGNTLMTTASQEYMNLNVKIGYIDDLIALSRWTGVTAYYSFPLINGKPNLQIDLALDPGRYQVSASLSEAEVINNAKIDQLIYQKAYYQLIQTDVKAYVSSSINAQAESPELSVETSILSNFAGNIYAYLQDVIANPNTANPPDNVTISLPIELDNTAKIFELTVELTVERTGDIDPEFENVATVKSISNTIKPITTSSDNGTSDQTVSLTAFASQFEETFINLPVEGNFLKITTGIDRFDTTNLSNKKVWVVHFDENGKNGIYFTINNEQQNFFAPKPLANNLMTLDNVSINNYRSGESYPYGTPQIVTFSGIDLDSWGRQCLEAIDEFLSAEYATPAYLLDGDGTLLSEVLAVKEKIAEGITNTVSNILETEGDSSLEDAQAKLKQRLLVQLSDAYKIDAIVQNSATIEDGFSGTTENPVPNLYGQMVGNLAGTTLSANALVGDGEQPSNEYSLSTAKVPLGIESSWLTYLFEAKEADKHSSFNFEDMSYKISYIEHQIGTVENMGEYQASSWLSFVIPLDAYMMDVGAIDIPIPLRSYPALPTVTSQVTHYTQTGGSDKSTTIEGAKEWGYQFSYQSSAISQDQFDAQIQFNVNANSQLQGTYLDEDGNYDPLSLPATLAQFISSYPAIRQDFVEALLQVNVDNTENEQAKYAVEAFIDIISNIGTAWQKWSEALTNLQVGNLNEITYQWGIIEAPETEGENNTDLIIIINPFEKAPMPAISISGYETEVYGTSGNEFRFKDSSTGEYLTYADRNSVSLRTLTLDDLGILDYQSAWGGVYLTRNQDLVENSNGTYKTTNPDFIYQTPLVKFYNPLVPLLICNESIYVSEINSQGNPQELPLDKQLQKLFTALMENSGGNNQTFKLEVNYAYSLWGNDETNPISLPVLMTPPVLYSNTASDKANAVLSTGSFNTSDLTSILKNWFEKYQPNQTNGKLNFVIEIYSTGNRQLPVLKLNNVVLRIEYVSDL